MSQLREQVPDAKYDGKALVFMLVQLLHFQEAALGKEVSKAKRAKPAAEKPQRRDNCI